MNITRKELEKQQRRGYILECAEKLFAEKGFDGVTVADIAKASEFSVGSLYLFFESKEALIQQLILDRLGQVRGILREEVDSEKAAMKKIEDVVRKLTDLFIEHFNFFKVLGLEIKRSEGCCPGGGLGEELQKSHKEILELMLLIFKEGVDEGAIRDDIDPLYMALSLDGLMHTMLSYSVHIDGDVSLPEMRDGMVELYFRGVTKRGKSRRKKG